MKKCISLGPVVLILLFHLWLLSNLIFTAWPEMLSYPFLLNSGFVIYRDFVMPYPPLLPLFLELWFKLFNFDVHSLRLLTWLLIMIVDFNLFYLIKRISKSQKISLGLLAIYVPIQALLDGNMLWFDFATLVPLSFGLITLFKWLNNQKGSYLFSTVAFFGIATAIKQTTILYFIPLALCYLIYKKKLYSKDLLTGALALGLIWVPLISYLLVKGSILSFWLWNFVYPLTEWSKFPGYVALSLTRDQKLILIILIASIVVTMMGLSKKIWTDLKFWTLLGFVLVAGITVYPRFSFFHLQPALFLIILLLGYSLSRLKSSFQVIVFGLLVINLILIVKFELPTTLGSNQIRFDGPEDQQLTKSLKSYLKPGDRVYFLGLSSLEYVQTQTLPTKPWVDNFGWYLEMPDVQRQVINGLIKNKPQFIFWQKPSSGMWYELGVYQPKQIVSFINQSYIQSGQLNNGIEIWTRKD